MGRAKLKTLKDTTLNTFFEITAKFNLQNQYIYKEQRGLIIWNNGSEIILKDLFFYPSDPDFNELGSLEISGAFIDECNQIVQKAWQIVKSRIRYKLNEYKLIPKMLGTCNPSQTWVYSQFYKPSQSKTLKNSRKFIQALPKDNPHLPPSYLESLLELDDNSKQRLYYGNWDYDNDPSKLCEYDAICDLFTNDHVKGDTKYISSDLAMQGRDRFLAGYWEGLCCTIELDQKKSTGKSIELDLKDLKIRKGVGNSNIIADSDGLGAYLESYIDHIKTFHGGGSALNKYEFANIKSECAFKLAELINNRKIRIICTPEQEEEIKKELSICLKRDNIFNDERKKKLITKDKMKEALGNSPDYLDMLLMRMYFEINKDELVFEEQEIRTYKEIPTELIDNKEVKQGKLFAFIATPDEGLSTFSMPILRIIDQYIYLEDVIFNRDELIDQEIKVKEKIAEYDIKRVVAETSKPMASFKTRLQEKNTNTEVYGDWSDPKKMPRILGHSGIIKKHFLFPENPNEETRLFIQQIFKLIKTSTDENEAASSLSGAAKHLESHYGLFK